jgi:hypothetical protein
MNGSWGRPSSGTACLPTGSSKLLGEFRAGEYHKERYPEDGHDDGESTQTQEYTKNNREEVNFGRYCGDLFIC